MSLDGTESLDAVSEIQEINEIPSSEPSTQFTEPEFTESTEVGPENIENLLSVEENKAEDVLQLTGNAIKTAGEATNPDLFTEEGNKLQDLENELKGISSDTVVGTRYTEEDKSNAIGFGHTTFNQPNESVQTIAPEENKEDFKALIDRVEIPVHNKEEEDLIEKASGVITNNKIGTLTPAETQNLITNLETIGTRELPGDERYNIATEVLKKQRQYDLTQRPLTIAEGARDLTTGETFPIQVYPTIKERFSVENPKLSLKEQSELKKELQNNPRAKLEGLLSKLKEHEGKHLHE